MAFTRFTCRQESFSTDLRVMELSVVVNEVEGWLQKKQKCTKQL